MHLFFYWISCFDLELQQSGDRFPQKTYKKAPKACNNTAQALEAGKVSVASSEAALLALVLLPGGAIP